MEVTNANAGVALQRMIQTIHDNKAYLSEIDGAIADGDHGINMDKGFSMVEAEISGQSLSLSEGLKTLGRTLLMEIGGSMGPLYGSMFKKMARASKDAEVIDSTVLAAMITSGYEAIVELGGAAVGDKTLVDTLAPAAEAASAAAGTSSTLPDAIDQILESAEKGWRSTEDMVAKIGRSARLGERSRGVLDAGATSCYLLLKAMGETLKVLAAGGTP